VNKIFRGFVVKDWFRGVESKMIKYHSLNKVIIKYSVIFYNKCWKERNKVFHSKEAQTRYLN